MSGMDLGNSGCKGEKEKGEDGSQISPRTGVSKNLEKMNVMNFIKQKSQGGKNQGEYPKEFNRQGSKKLI
jgi:hypothetical protein